MKDMENNFNLPLEVQPELFSKEWAMLILEQSKMPKTAGSSKKVKKADTPLGKKGGRNAKAITREDFMRKSIEMHNKKSYTSEEDWNGENDNARFSLEAFMEIPAVKKDLSKIIFDTENSTADNSVSPLSKGGSLLGIQSLDNGLEFIGFSSGGDWELPIFLIVYWDGKSFRGYIPISGNMVNTDFKCAFGSELDSDYGPYGTKSHMMKPEYEDVEEDKLTTVCLANLGFPTIPDYKNGIKLDWESIEEDIRGRIVVSQ